MDVCLCGLLAGAVAGLYCATTCWFHLSFSWVYDSFRGMACSGAPSQWCVQVSLQLSATFNTTLYTEPVALILAQIWCHRTQYLYDQHRHRAHGGAPDHAFPEYLEPEAARGLREHGPAVQARLEQIRDLQPRGAASSRGPQG